MILKIIEAIKSYNGRIISGVIYTSLMVLAIVCIGIGIHILNQEPDEEISEEGGKRVGKYYKYSGILIVLALIESLVTYIIRNIQGKPVWQELQISYARSKKVEFLLK